MSTKSRDDEQFPTVKQTAPAREPEAIELQNIVKKLYPTLKLSENEETSC